MKEIGVDHTRQIDIFVIKERINAKINKNEYGGIVDHGDNVIMWIKHLFVPYDVLKQIQSTKFMKN